VRAKKPKSRDRYVSNAEFNAIRDALLIGDDGKPTRSGQMVQCYVDLSYLLAQRGTDVRLLRWSEVAADGIRIKPSKTANSSGVKVLLPLTESVKAVLERARNLSTVKSLYVIHTLAGRPYSASGLCTLWVRACVRAGIANATLKDLRAKALTDAKQMGYTKEQLQITATHSDLKTTEIYIKSRETPVSEVVLKLPQK
jgi:integrase